MASQITTAASSNGHKMIVYVDQSDIQRAVDTLEFAVGKIPEYMRQSVFVDVRGYGNVAPYVRAMPGKTQLAGVLGKEFFEGLGILISMGFEAYADYHNDKLSPAQKLGDMSATLLLAVACTALPPLGLAYVASQLVDPGSWNRATAYAFSSQAPWIDFISNQMLKIPGFQQSLARAPSWVTVLLQ